MCWTKKATRWRDKTLSSLCAQSKVARDSWLRASRPLEEVLFEEKCRLRRAVRRRVKFCAARAERLRIQRRDLLFSTHNKYRFSALHKRRSGCGRLVVDGKIVTDLRARLDEWAQHFGGLAESNTDSIPALKVLSDKVDGLVGESLTNDEHLLDVPFSAVEVTGAVKRLKNRKSPGPDGVMAEHLKAGGESIIIWLMNILNAVVDLEVIPDLLKVGIVVPVYKGGGKDPLQVNSYRGITLSSMVGRCWNSCC